MRDHNPGVGSFQRKYSDEQRAAVTIAYLDRNIRPARRIVELAAEGKLADTDGAPVARFQVVEDTIRTLARDERRARVGQRRTMLQEAPAHEAVEELRRRLVSAL